MSKNKSISRATQRRIYAYKKVLERLDWVGFRIGNPYLCVLLGHSYSTDIYFPEFWALHPGRLHKDGTAKWWDRRDVESRKNALAIAIALAELQIPLPEPFHGHQY